MLEWARRSGRTFEIDCPLQNKLRLAGIDSSTAAQIAESSPDMGLGEFLTYLADWRNEPRSSKPLPSSPAKSSRLSEGPSKMLSALFRSASQAIVVGPGITGNVAALLPVAGAVMGAGVESRAAKSQSEADPNEFT